MADTVVSTNIVKFKFALYDETIYHRGLGAFTVSLKNPLPDVQSDEMITRATAINSSLSGALHGIWFGDNLESDFTVEKLVKMNIFEQTKTISEDGKTVTTVSREKEIFNSPFTPPD